VPSLARPLPPHIVHVSFATAGVSSSCVTRGLPIGIRARIGIGVALDIGIDLPSLCLVVLGRCAFLLGTLCLLLGGEALALGTCGLLFGSEPGLLRAQAARRRLVAVRGSRDATLVERLSAPPSSRDRGHKRNESHDDHDDDDDGCSRYEKWHFRIPSSSGQSD
jgi:hypothetical protein